MIQIRHFRRFDWIWITMEGIDSGLKPNKHFNTLTNIIGKAFYKGLALSRRVLLFNEIHVVVY